MINQRSVAHELEGPAAMSGDVRIENVAAIGLEAFEGASLIALHQSTVTDHVERIAASLRCMRGELFERTG